MKSSKCSSNISTGATPMANATTRNHRHLVGRTERVADEMFKALEEQDKQGVINPIYVMADSGARGFVNSRSGSFPVCAV